jgi:Ca2+-binding EF-hand superfamily protein
MKPFLIALGVLASFTAVAADHPPPTRVTDRPLTKIEARFRALDVNNDRQLSDTEFRADATSPTEFASLDKDGDGFVSLAEFRTRPIPPAPK